MGRRRSQHAGPVVWGGEHLDGHHQTWIMSLLYIGTFGSSSASPSPCRNGSTYKMIPRRPPVGGVGAPAPVRRRLWLCRLPGPARAGVRLRPRRRSRGQDRRPRRGPGRARHPPVRSRGARIPLIVVLGHQGCGAVTAALEAVETGGHPSAGQVGYLTLRIKPAVLRASARRATLSITPYGRTPSWWRSGSSPIRIGRGTADARLQVVSARYDLATGRVELLQCPGPEHLKRRRSSADTS